MKFCANLQVFAELPSLSFVKSASLIGHNNSQEMRTSQMQDTIEKFRDGRVCIKPFCLTNDTHLYEVCFLVENVY